MGDNQNQGKKSKIKETEILDIEQRECSDLDQDQEVEGKNGKSLREEVNELKDAVKLLLENTKRKRSLSPIARSSISFGSRSDSESDDDPPRTKKCQPQTKREKQPVLLDDLDNLSSVHSDGELVSEDESLQGLESFYEISPKKGPQIEGKLATIIDNGLCQRLDDEKIKEIGNKYLPPGNTKNVRVPRTNPEIWKLLSKAQRTRDIKLQRTHNIVTSMLTASINLLSKVRTVRKNKGEVDLKSLENTMTDITRLASACFTDISGIRRESMKSGISERFRPLCTKEDTESNSTEFLFGENLNQRIKELGESSKLSNALAPSKFMPKNLQRGRPNYYQQKVGRNNSGDDPRKPFPSQRRNFKPQSFNKRNY